jgi:spoIIIJ-associated protein
VVEYEVLHDPVKRLFGRVGEKPAKVRVWLKDGFAAEMEEARSIARDVIDEEDEARDSASSNEELEGEDASDEDEDEGDEEPDEDEEADESTDGDDSSEDDSDDYPAPAERTEEELDQVADTGISVIQGLLEHLAVEAEIEEYEGDDGEIILDIVGPDLGILIGRHGKTLDALQTIVTTLVRRRLGWYHPLLVDVEGYRARRREKLEEIAKNAANRASKQAKDVRLRPMNSFERKVVHIALRDDRRVYTESDGEEPNRAVVVSPK